MTRAEKEFLDTIDTLRFRTLMTLKLNVEKLSGLASALSKKIEEHGTNAYYSVNSDIRRASDQIWSAEMRLGELKKIEEDFKVEIKKRLKLKKESNQKKSSSVRDN